MCHYYPGDTELVLNLQKMKENLKEKTKESITESTTDRTTESTTDRILRLIKENPHITNEQIAQIVGITEDGVFYHTSKLRKKGIIICKDGKQKGHWEILK